MKELFLLLLTSSAPQQPQDCVCEIVEEVTSPVPAARNYVTEFGLIISNPDPGNCNAPGCGAEEPCTMRVTRYVKTDGTEPNDVSFGIGCDPPDGNYHHDETYGGLDSGGSCNDYLDLAGSLPSGNTYTSNEALLVVTCGASATFDFWAVERWLSLEGWWEFFWFHLGDVTIHCKECPAYSSTYGGGQSF